MERWEQLFTRTALRLGRPARYALAVLAPALALVAKLALDGVPTGFAYITFYPAVVVSAALGGLGPGLLALALSAGAAWLWLLPHEGAVLVTASGSLLATALF